MSFPSGLAGNGAIWGAGNLGPAPFFEENGGIWGGSGGGKAPKHRRPLMEPNLSSALF